MNKNDTNAVQSDPPCLSDAPCEKRKRPPCYIDAMPKKTHCVYLTTCNFVEISLYYILFNYKLITNLIFECIIYFVKADLTEKLI